ncbi:MAG: hypothetical protein WBK10_02980 [Bacillota bacterium]|jgi:hypothetical protein|nr:hypothetical protein [Bacillota bacterium]
MKLPKLRSGRGKRAGGSSDGRIIGITALVALGVIIATVTFIARISSEGPYLGVGVGTAGPVITAVNVSERLSETLAKANAVGTGHADPDFGVAALGRWDPFKSLVVEIPPPEPEPEPEPLDLTPPPPPDPPRTVLTGVLRSGLRAIAIFNVQGYGAIMAAVGDEAYPGGVVKDIGERDATVAFMGREFKYLLGGDRL